MSKEKFKMSKSDLAKHWKAGLEVKDDIAGAGFVPEEGRYAAVLTDCERNESQGSGRDQVMFEFTFVEGDYKGKTTRAYDGLDRPEGIPYVMKRIEALGGEVPEDIEELEDALKKLKKSRPKVRIRIKHKDDFVNVYIDGMLDADEADEIEDEEDEDEEEAPAKSKVSKEKAAPAEEADEDEAEDEQGLEVGMRVKCLDDDEEEEGRGEVTAIDEDNSEVTVKIEKTGKKVVYPADKLRLLPKEKEAPKKGLKVKK